MDDAAGSSQTPTRDTHVERQALRRLHLSPFMLFLLFVGMASGLVCDRLWMGATSRRVLQEKQVTGNTTTMYLQAATSELDPAPSSDALTVLPTNITGGQVPDDGRSPEQPATQTVPDGPFLMPLAAPTPVPTPESDILQPGTTAAVCTFTRAEVLAAQAELDAILSAYKGVDLALAIAAMKESLEPVTTLTLTGWKGMDDAAVRALEPAFRFMPCLRQLQLTVRCPGLGVEAANAVARSLIRLPSLTYLDMSNGCLNATAMDSMRHGFDGLRQLQWLDISSNPIGPDGAVSLAAALNSTTQLLALNISSTQMDGPAMITLEPSLSQLVELRTLYNNDNPIGLVGAHVLGRVFAHTTALKQLGIHRSQLNATAMHALRHGLAHLPDLRLLDIGDNPIGQIGATSSAFVLNHTRQLTQLNVRRTGLNAPAVLALGPPLMNLRQLESLDMGDNDLGTVGAEMLASVLNHTHAVTSLSIDRTKMGYAAMLRLAPALVGLKRLTTLNIRYNPLGPRSVPLLSTIIRNHNLTRLDITGIGLDAAGMCALAPAFEHLPQVDVLEMSSNSIGPVGAKCLVAGLAHIRQMQEFRCRDMDIDEASQSAIMRASRCYSGSF